MIQVPVDVSIPPLLSFSAPVTGSFQSGTLSVGLDLKDLPVAPSGDANLIFLAYDTVQATFQQVPIAAVAAAAALVAPVQSVAGRAGAVSLVVTDVAGAAPLASPTLTGTPTAPTPAVSDNSTKLATTAFVNQAAIAAGAVTSVAGRQGSVVLATGDVSGAAPLASPALTGAPTAPTAASADNSTKLATTAYADRAVSSLVVLAPPTGRLTTVSGVGVTTSDITGSTAVFYTGAVGIPLYNGTAFINRLIGELTLPLDATTSDPGYHAANAAFDAFVFSNGGTVALGTGPAWTNPLAGRGTGAGTTELQLLNGIWTNKNAITLRFGLSAGNTVVVPANQATYVGSFFTTAAGQTTDRFSARLLFNAYNQARRPMRVSDPTTSWTYSTAAWRVANGNAANQLQVFLGLSGIGVNARAVGAVSTSAAGANATACGIGTLNNVDASNIKTYGFPTSGTPVPLTSEYDDFPGLGLVSLYWLEYGAGAQTQTWYGATGTIGTGMTGSFLG